MSFLNAFGCLTEVNTLLWAVYHEQFTDRRDDYDLISHRVQSDGLDALTNDSLTFLHFSLACFRFGLGLSLVIVLDCRLQSLRVESDESVLLANEVQTVAYDLDVPGRVS